MCFVYSILLWDIDITIIILYYFVKNYHIQISIKHDLLKCLLLCYFIKNVRAHIMTKYNKNLFAFIDYYNVTLKF